MCIEVEVNMMHGVPDAYARNAIGVGCGALSAMMFDDGVTCAAGALIFLMNPVSDLCLLRCCHAVAVAYTVVVVPYARFVGAGTVVKVVKLIGGPTTYDGELSPELSDDDSSPELSSDELSPESSDDELSLESWDESSLPEFEPEPQRPPALSEG